MLVHVLWTHRIFLMAARANSWKVIIFCHGFFISPMHSRFHLRVYNQTLPRVWKSARFENSRPKLGLKTAIFSVVLRRLCDLNANTFGTNGTVDKKYFVHKQLRF